MNSFYTYTQQHNCNQILKNSPFFSIYHKKILKNSYIKSNNEIRGFYKDSILNDVVYFSSNGLKKNAIFRSKEIKLNPNQTTFISYFKDLENDLLIFNLYSQKYNVDLIKNYLNKQEVLYNWNKKNKPIKEINSFFLKNLKENKIRLNRPIHLKTVTNIFIKNIFEKYYFLNSSGFIRQLNGKSLQKSIFGGLYFILTKNIQRTFKNIFILNYQLINFFSNIKNFVLNKNYLLNNIVIYTFFLKYLNYKIINYLNNNKIKIRKSNWILYKYIKLYITPITNLINYFYLFNLNKFTRLTEPQIIGNWLENSLNKNFSIKEIKQNIKNLNISNKITLLNKVTKNIQYKIIYSNKDLINSNKLLWNYFGYKSIIVKNILQLININYNIGSGHILYFNNLLQKKLNDINPNVYWSSNRILFNLPIINNNKFIYLNEYNTFFDRNFLNYVKTSSYINFNKTFKLIKSDTYSKLSLVNQTKEIKKVLNKFKRSFIRKKKNKKLIKKINKSFTLSSKKFKIAKLKRLKYPWIKLYNNSNINK